MSHKKVVYADDVKDLLKGLSELPWDEEVDHLVDSLPTVEETQGHWENVTGGMVVLGNCSECKTRQPVIGTKYCKRCGTRMRSDYNAT